MYLRDRALSEIFLLLTGSESRDLLVARMSTDGMFYYHLTLNLVTERSSESDIASERG